MWNAKILDKGIKLDRIAVQVEFNKTGEESIKINFEGRTVEEINRTIKNYKDALDSRDAELAALSVGDWREPTVEEIVADEPTQEELAETAWNEAKSKLEQALALKKMAEDSGRTVTPERQAEIDALAAFVDENFKIEYVK